MTPPTTLMSWVLPSSGSNRPVNMLIVVDFPAPLCPSRASISFFLTLRDNWLTAATFFLRKKPVVKNYTHRENRTVHKCTSTLHIHYHPHSTYTTIHTPHTLPSTLHIHYHPHSTYTTIHTPHTLPSTLHIHYHPHSTYTTIHTPHTLPSAEIHIAHRHTYMHVHMYTPVQTHMHIQLYIHVHTCIKMHTHAHMHTHAQTCTHVQAHMYTHSLSTSHLGQSINHKCIFTNPLSFL